MNLKKICDGVEQRAKHAALSLLKQEGYSDEEARAFLEVLYEKIPNLKGSLRPYVQGIVRWFLEGDLDDENPEDFAKVNTFLKVFKTSPAHDALDRNFNSEISERPVSFEEAKDLVGVDLDPTPVKIDTEHTYKVLRINSFDDLVKYAHLVPKWCVIASEDVFNHYTLDGINRFYLCIRDDAETVKATPGDIFPQDDYGFSVIAVIIDPENEVASVTSRWNTDDEADVFLSDEGLQSILGDEYYELF